MNCSKVALQVKTNFLLGKQATQAQSTLKAEEETLEMIDKSGKEGEGEWEGEESAGAEGEGEDGEFDEGTGPLSNEIV